jgi:hypothetical protein
MIGIFDGNVKRAWKPFGVNDVRLKLIKGCEGFNICARLFGLRSGPQVSLEVRFLLYKAQGDLATEDLRMPPVSIWQTPL